MNLETPSQPELDESIVLRPEEQIRRLTTFGWNKFLASVPVPSLWVTAHVDLSPSRHHNAALDHLRTDLLGSHSEDVIANLYRVFLQKVLTPLNRKILKSRTSSNTFRFLGSLERNGSDLTHKALHYHFFLWDAHGLFLSDPDSMQHTARTFESIWLRKVNSKVSVRYKPIDIQFVRTREDAIRVASYMNKANPFVKSYELFDDWSTSRLKDNPQL
jgi:hypothetical protein